MDDAGDPGFSRAPHFEDLVSLCLALNREGARYVVIGGFAVILHGLVRTTKDIDLLVDPSPENVKKVKQALASLPDNAGALVADDDVANYRVVRVADEFVVDLMAEACGLSFKDVAVEGIEFHTVDGVAIPIASKETLIRTKATLRDSDRSDDRVSANNPGWVALFRRDVGGGDSPIDGEGRAVDIRRLIGSEKQGGIGNFLRAGQTSRRNVHHAAPTPRGIAEELG